MNITIKKNEFDINNIYYLDPIKNTVIENSNFIRILYSNELFSLNGLYILLNFQNINSNINNNKVKYSFDCNLIENIELINFIKKLEYDILENSIINNKRPYYKLHEQISQGIIKMVNILFIDPKNQEKKNLKEEFILKISGIWESENEYGLTYKILEVQNANNSNDSNNSNDL